jgi:hypothetical protein
MLFRIVDYFQILCLSTILFLKCGFWKLSVLGYRDITWTYIFLWYTNEINCKWIFLKFCSAVEVMKKYLFISWKKPTSLKNYSVVRNSTFMNVTWKKETYTENMINLKLGSHNRLNFLLTEPPKSWFLCLQICCRIFIIFNRFLCLKVYSENWFIPSLGLKPSNISKWSLLFNICFCSSPFKLSIFDIPICDP